jgi:hypothetical protein
MRPLFQSAPPAQGPLQQGVKGRSRVEAGAIFHRPPPCPTIAIGRLRWIVIEAAIAPAPAK